MLRLRRVGGLVVVEARVFGPLKGRSLVLAVDTASTYSTIPAEVAGDVGLSPVPGRSVPIVNASGILRAPLAVAPAFAATGLRRDGFSLVIIDLPKGVAPVVGLLGLDFFAGRKLCFDFAAGELELL